MQTGNEKLTEVIGRLGSALSGLTVFHSELGKPPLSALMALLTAADAGDARAAAVHASRFTSALISCGSRRVSGDLMMDYVLDTVLMTNNPFAVSAAAGHTDEAVFRAMGRDLAAFRLLSELDEDAVDRIVTECGTARQPDTAVQLATAAWGGAQAPHFQKERQPAPPFRYVPPEHCWHYGEFGLRDAYFADAALEGMYRRFLENDEWTELASDLWSFHSSYGSGDFLRYRNFFFDGAKNRLFPLPDLRAGDFVQLAETEYRSLLNNAIAFLRDESARPMLLVGAEGMGKTTLMLELTDELPQLRLISVLPGAPRASVLSMLDTLRAQPLKFMTLFDPLDPSSLSGLAEPMLPMNVLLAACTPAPVLQSLFEVTVILPRMQLSDFIRVVMKLLEADKINMPESLVRSACVDYQVDTGCEFTVANAVRVKELLQS